MNKVNKLSIRPMIDGLNQISSGTKEEQFQNETLRPIIKLQHDLLVAFFNHHVKALKTPFVKLAAVEKKKVINLRFTKDHRMKLELRGLVIGHFTIEEYNQYNTMASEMNKRMVTIIKERLLSMI